MGSWKSLINIKEIKKASGTILRFWDINQQGFKISRKPLNLDKKIRMENSTFHILMQLSNKTVIF